MMDPKKKQMYGSRTSPKHSFKSLTMMEDERYKFTQTASLRFTLVGSHVWFLEMKESIQSEQKRGLILLKKREVTYSIWYMT